MEHHNNIILSVFSWFLVSMAHFLPEYILWTKAIATTLAIIVSAITIYKFLTEKKTHD